MPWLDDVLARLGSAAGWGYLPDGPSAAEPAALAALALMAHEQADAARGPLNWLGRQQSPSGGCGVLSGEADPAWPTAWAVLAWTAGQRAADCAAIKNGAAWLLATEGKPLPKNEGLGHDTTLIGWPWVETTHSWVEPTAMAVIALKAAGMSQHPRTREAVRLLIDRLLEAGGCNYGNTMVLEQTLRPHMQPTGICLWALAGEPDRDGRIGQAIDYLRRDVPRQVRHGFLELCSDRPGGAGSPPATDRCTVGARSAANARAGAGGLSLGAAGAGRAACRLRAIAEHFACADTGAIVDPGDRGDIMTATLTPTPQSPQPPRAKCSPHGDGSFNRRTLLIGGSAAIAGWLAYPYIQSTLQGRAAVFLAQPAL